MTKNAYSWGVTLVPLASAQRAQTAKALAAAFRSTVQATQSAIDAGASPTVAEFLSTSTAANSQALGGQNVAWRPWGVKLAAQLGGLSTTELTTVPQYLEAWKAIAAGLDYVAAAP